MRFYCAFGIAVQDVQDVQDKSQLFLFLRVSMTHER